MTSFIFFLAFFSLFSFSIYAALFFLVWYFVITSIKRHISCKYNPYSWLNICCMKSKNVWLRFIVSSFRTSMSYLSQLRAILYCSNNTSLFAVLFHGKRIPNGSILFRWRSNTYVLINFWKPLWILNICKMQKTLSLPAASWMTMVFLQLRHTKHWFAVWA